MTLKTFLLAAWLTETLEPKTRAKIDRAITADNLDLGLEAPLARGTELSAGFCGFFDFCGHF